MESDYYQEDRPPPPLLCTYMGGATNGRKPFRFLLKRECPVCPLDDTI
jgi:hypothetical protein